MIETLNRVYLSSMAKCRINMRIVIA